MMKTTVVIYHCNRSIGPQLLMHNSGIPKSLGEKKNQRFFKKLSLEQNNLSVTPNTN